MKNWKAEMLGNDKKKKKKKKKKKIYKEPLDKVLMM